MKILLLGKNGQLARRLLPALLPIGEVFSYGREEVDFKDRETLKKCIQFHNPDAIINAVAYTAVDQAETDAKTSFLVNTEAVKVITDEAIKINACLIHYSSDYVFDGQKKVAYIEKDICNPLSIYGKSKAMADEYIQSFCKRYIIFRTSWVFDTYGNNFPKKILRLAQEKDSLKVVDDQVSAPNNASFIANITALVLHKILYFKEASEWSGLYHLSASGETSWFGFAHALLKRAVDLKIPLTCQPENLIPISSLEHSLPAQRPEYSALDTTRLCEKFGLVMPRWDLYTANFLEEFKIMGFL